MANQIQVRKENPLLRLQGEHSDPRRLQQWMEWSKSNAHLVAPAPAVGTLPEGFAVALSVVQIDASGDDVYDVGGGKLGLAKSPLQRIAGALGVSWDAQLSTRLDDGSDPHYCHYRAVGTVVQFDGTELQVIGDKEMDLRAGSAQVEALWERYHDQKRKWDSGQKGDRRYPPKEPTGQIREMRLHILAHAQTKAQLRAIRSLGVKSAYKKAELTKPFVVARLMFTGRSSDPQTQRDLTMMVAARHLGGRRALYGSGGNLLPPPQPPALQRHAPPPVGAVRADDDSYPGMVVGESVGAPVGQVVDAAPASDPGPAPVAARPAPPAQAARSDGGGDRAFTIPFGNSKGTPLDQAETKDLEWCANKIEENLRSGKTPDKFVAYNEALFAAMTDEIERRQGVVPADDEPEFDRGDDPDNY